MNNNGYPMYYNQGYNPKDVDNFVWIIIILLIIFFLFNATSRGNERRR